MQSKESPDGRKSTGNGKNKLVPIALVVTLLIASFTGSWALAGEVHNYRLRGIVQELERNFVGDEKTLYKVELIREEQIRVITTLDVIIDDIAEIARDIRVHDNEQEVEEMGKEKPIRILFRGKDKRKNTLARLCGFCSWARRGVR